MSASCSSAASPSAFSLTATVQAANLQLQECSAYGGIGRELECILESPLQLLLIAPGAIRVSELNERERQRRGDTGTRALQLTDIALQEAGVAVGLPHQALCRRDIQRHTCEAPGVQRSRGGIWPGCLQCEAEALLDYVVRKTRELTTRGNGPHDWAPTHVLLNHAQREDVVGH